MPLAKDKPKRTATASRDFLTVARFPVEISGESRAAAGHIVFVVCCECDSIDLIMFVVISRLTIRLKYEVTVRDGPQTKIEIALTT